MTQGCQLLSKIFGLDSLKNSAAGENFLSYYLIYNKKSLVSSVHLARTLLYSLADFFPNWDFPRIFLFIGIIAGQLL
jgi:hypothetical protein